ncbi:MAG: glycosyltransferase family 39 protein [Candidatus Latescibacterota bacterium]|jgi:4-amino-4-deoxy-L-arabinose transferase-like glycosyltransferase
MTEAAHPPESAATHPEESQAQPVAWKLLLIPAAVQLLLHLFTNGRYGIFRDEYYYLACAARPAWGYVDQPPFSIWVLTAWKAVFGDSVQSIRVLPALCGSGLIVLTGAVAAQLGGGRWAQVLAAVASGIGAAGLVIAGFYSMNCYDILFWTGVYYLLIRIARTGDGRLWPWLGLVLGVGLFNKVGLLVWGLALVIGLAATKHRRHFLDRRMYLGGLIAVVFMLPYLLWNFANDWPTLEFIENAKRYKIAAFSPLGFLSENILEANPLTVPMWLGGLLWLFIAKRARRFRIVAIMVVVTWIVLVLQKSKPYYFASSFPVMMAAGGVAWERWTGGRRWGWVRWALAVVLLAGLVIFMPLALPVLSPEGVDAYQKKLGIVPSTGEVGADAELPQYFSDRFGWENLARTVSHVYTELPEDERDNCIVWGRNYGHAGSLEYWSRKYELPPVFSTHNNYWFWGPPDDDVDVVIVIGGSRESLKEFARDVREAAIAETPFARESRLTIWVCKGLRRPIGEIWQDLKNFI